MDALLVGVVINSNVRRGHVGLGTYVDEVVPIHLLHPLNAPFADEERSKSRPPVEESPSVFTRLEDTRAELESQFGFNRFLEIYTQIQVLYTTEYGSIDNVLQPSLYNYYTLLIALVKY